VDCLDPIVCGLQRGYGQIYKGVNGPSDNFDAFDDECEEVRLGACLKEKSLVWIHEEGLNGRR
jgi:hypothetical protein